MHRVQLNMHTIVECQRVANVLLRRGVSILDQTPRSGRPGTSGSIASATETRGRAPQPAFTPRLSPNKESVRREIFGHDPLPTLPFIREENVAPLFAVPARPTTSQMYRSHTLASEHQQFNRSGHPPSALQATRGPPSKQTLIHGAEGTAQQPGSAGLPTSKARVDSSKDSCLGISNELRESINQSGSRPGSSALLLPPLPRPNPIKESFSSSTLRANSSPEAQSIGVEFASSSKRSSEAEYYDVSEGHTPIPSASLARPSLQNLVSSRRQTEKPKLMDELLRRRQPLAETSRNNKVPRLSSLADAPHEIVTPPATSIADQASESRMEAAASMCKSDSLCAKPSDQERLESYASQTDDDRRAAFEEFMVANIDNPAFTKLCEDVESYWRRIALHM